jgi:hypothetical protein
MPHIVLTEEQARILAQAGESLEVRDPKGEAVAYLSPLDAFELESIRLWKETRDNPGPGIPSEQVQDHFRRLEVIRQREGMDIDKALELLRKMRAGEEV